MARIMKEDIFYTLLKEFSDELLEAAELYRDIVCGYPDTFSFIPQMKVMETECDERVKTIMGKLYTSFITPFEREDISDLTLALDDVIDCMNGVTKMNESATKGRASNMNTSCSIVFTSFFMDFDSAAARDAAVSFIIL